MDITHNVLLFQSQPITDTDFSSYRQIKPGKADCKLIDISGRGNRHAGG